MTKKCRDLVAGLKKARRALLGERDPDPIDAAVTSTAIEANVAAQVALTDRHKGQKEPNGVCQSCGFPIEPERLKILPDTDKCATCANKHPMCACGREIEPARLVLHLTTCAQCAADAARIRQRE